MRASLVRASLLILSNAGIVEVLVLLVVLLSLLILTFLLFASLVLMLLLLLLLPMWGDGGHFGLEFIARELKCGRLLQVTKRQSLNV